MRLGKSLKNRRNKFQRNRIFTVVVYLVFTCFLTPGCAKQDAQRPNVVFVFADQWRAQDVGYAGNTIVQTPAIDKLAAESLVFTNAVSGCPVCCPYRASLLTGQYPLTHGVFYNDKPLNPEATTLAKIYKQAGYQTGYIGKWHLNGHEPGEDTFEARLKFIPKNRRQGFDFWQAFECTHDYNHSFYFEDTPERLEWPGYDAIAQTQSAIEFITEKANEENPFLLVLSWGPPHAPYHTAPEKYREMFSSEDITVRPNVPQELRKKARQDIAGYYAHISALDDCMKDLVAALEKQGIAENTILVFTSDHGDMLYSHGNVKKQQPWDEALRVPFILRYPKKLGNSEKKIATPINTPDILPTLLGLSGIEIPESVEGNDYSEVLTGKEQPENDAVLIQCPVPFHQWNYQRGGREYRGVRTKRYTYVRDLNGPWLLYDNLQDPFQMNNLTGLDEYIYIQGELENKLQKLLQKTGDKFLPAHEYMKMWNYRWDRNDSIRTTGS